MRPHGLLPKTCPYRVLLETAERQMLERAIAGAEGSVQVAAERLGVTRKYLYDRLDALDMEAYRQRRWKKAPRAPKPTAPEPVADITDAAEEGTTT